MARSRGAVRVLHLDDETEVLEVTGQLLEAQHDRLTVEQVRSTAGALDRLDEADCVVADYVMPEMDGAEFLSEVRRSRPSLPVVFFTGRDAGDLDEAVFADDLTDHVRKGVSTDQYGTLADAVADLVDEADPAGRTVEVENGPGE
jgi:CheY-like chemotaxis protein